MKNRILILALGLLFLSAYAEDEISEDEILEDEPVIIKKNEAPCEFQISPKKEQEKTLARENARLEKRKTEFQKRIDNELRLLRGEDVPVDNN